VDELWRVAYERATVRTNLEDIMAVGIEEAEVDVSCHFVITRLTVRNRVRVNIERKQLCKHAKVREKVHTTVLHPRYE
jgi:hypothetical protein